MDTAQNPLTPKLTLGHYPGTISRSPSDGYYPGTKTVFFWTVKAYDRFFQEKPGESVKPFIVIEAKPVAYCLGLFVGILCTYTKQLTEEEEEDMNFVTRETDLKLAERRQKRAEAQQEQRQVQAMATQEQARLALIGQKYEKSVKHMRAEPDEVAAARAKAALAAGDPEVLFGNKDEAFKAGYVKGYETGASTGRAQEKDDE